MRARHALEEQRHPLRRGERKEHRLVVFATRATHVVGPGQRRVGPHVLNHGRRLRRGVVNGVPVHAMIIRVHLVLAVLAHVHQLLALAIFAGIQQIVRGGAETQLDRAGSAGGFAHQGVIARHKSAGHG